MSLFDTEFYDLYIHPIPDNRDSIVRFATEARRYGYSGCGIINSRTNADDIPIPEKFHIYNGNEISCKPSKLRDEIKKFIEKKEIIIVKGGEEELNRTAVETDVVDILMQPSKFNDVLAKAACDNSVALGFNIGSIIRMRGNMRVRELSIMRTNLKHARKYGVKMILTCDPHSQFDLRAPREVAALSSLFGMAVEEAVDAMSETPRYILKRKHPDYIQEGIEII